MYLVLEAVPLGIPGFLNLETSLTEQTILRGALDDIFEVPC